MIISYFIDDANLRMCYWLVIVLFGLTIFNVVLSVQYYIKLRNERGIRGARGPSGERGEAGPQGVCAITEECGITDCRKNVVDMVYEKMDKHIPKSCLDNLNECKSDGQRELAEPLNIFIGQMEQECKRTEDPSIVFFSRVGAQLNEMKKNGHASSD